MKRSLRWACLALFLIAAAAVIWFLQLFVHENDTMQYIDWNSSVQILPDGTEQPFSPDDYGNANDFSGTFRFTGTLPTLSEDGSLLFEVAGMELSVAFNGQVLYQSNVPLPSDDGSQTAQAEIPISAGTSGELSVTCRITGNSVSMFPPLIRFIPERLYAMEYSAFANRSALPTGAAALAFVLIFGIFLLRIARKQPDWSLVPLLFAVLGLVVFRLIQDQGYYFLPERVVSLLGRQEVGLVVALLFFLYLICNHQRHFWKYLGITAAASFLIFMVCLIFSFFTGGSLSIFVTTLPETLRAGYYDGLVYWLTLWLALAAALISAYGVMQSFAEQQAKSQTLLVKNKLTLENYKDLEDRLAESASFRHELKHNLTALECLCQNGDYDEMKALLAKMMETQGLMNHATFTENSTINAILQNAAGKAARHSIRFSAHIHVPDKLNIPDADLCSLLMNLLDNALEAAEKVSPSGSRYIHIHIKVVNLYLAVKCENSFQGELRTDKDGNLLTTKEDSLSHGFGFRQMQKIAERYQSTILFHYSVGDFGRGQFVVQTALRIP